MNTLQTTAMMENNYLFLALEPLQKYRCFILEMEEPYQSETIFWSSVYLQLSKVFVFVLTDFCLVFVLSSV